MEMPYFRHLNVQACLPPGITGPSPELAELVYSRFSQGRERGGTWIHLGILQICLEQTPPFQNTTDVTIRDVRYPTNRLLPCPHRALLIEALASALQQYEYNCKMGERDPQALSEARNFALVILSRAVRDFQDLREKEALPALARRFPHNQTINDALQLLTDVVNVLSDPEQSLTTAEATARLWLCRSMKDAFERYAPKLKAIEIHHTMAAILLAFGVEQGTVPAIAARVKKRLQRASRPQY